MGWNLSASDRRRIRKQGQSSSDGRVVRRCGALLRLDRGDSVADVARDVGVSRQSLYNWKQKAVAAPGDLADRDRGGRPTVWRPRFVRRLQSLLEGSPRDEGFHAVTWTADLLQASLQHSLGFEVSTSSVRRKLHALGYVWKRFRYTLEPDPDRDKKKMYPQSHQTVARTWHRAV